MPSGSECILESITLLHSFTFNVCLLTLSSFFFEEFSTFIPYSVLSPGEILSTFISYGICMCAAIVGMNCYVMNAIVL